VKVKSKIQKSSKALEEIKLNESEKRYAGSYSAFVGWYGGDGGGGGV
jgi:hypothetical protein